MQSVKLNWLAILVAALVSFFFEAVWFSVFKIPWLEGVGRTQDVLLAVPYFFPLVQFGTALLCSIVAAAVLSALTQMTGPRTVRRSVLIAILVWVGFVATTWATEYVFEVRSLQIFFINAGYFLIALVLMAVITGAWKDKRVAV